MCRTRGTAELSRETPKDIVDFFLCLREAVSILSIEGREEDVELCQTRLKLLERDLHKVWSTFNRVQHAEDLVREYSSSKTTASPRHV